MAKLVLNDLSTLLTAITTINENLALIEAAIENTLSRDGTSPNEMEADLDMNNQHINNLPDAVSAQQPVTFRQLQDIIEMSTEPVTGLAAHLVDTTNAHAASAIFYNGGTGLIATDVEAAIDELATEKLDKVTSTTAGRLVKFTDGSGAVDDTTVIYEDEVNSRIGIGTTSPTSNVHVVSSSSPTVVLIENTSADSQSVVRLKNDAQQWATYVSNTDNYNVRDETASTTPFYIEAATPNETLVLSSDGLYSEAPFVGINSESPTIANTMFEVNGRIHNGDFDFYLGGCDQVSRGDSGTSRALVKLSGPILALNYSGDFTGGTRIGAAGATSNMFIQASSGGKVGIGTESPGSKLHVNGTIQMLSSTVASLPSASPAGQIIYVSNETGGATLAFSDGTNWRRVADRTVCA